MHYVTDTKEVRAAREAVTEAKESIQIANLQKEISGLNDIIDDLDKKIEESNKYYDDLIEQTKKYWDSLIKGLEEYKSRWKELADIEEQAKMEVALRNLGITTDDVLNMSESAFESFKGTYLGLLQEMYAGNDEMIGMLQNFGGISTNTLKPLSGTISNVADSIDRFADSTGNANTNTSEVSESVGNLSTNTEELGDNLSGVSDTLDGIIDEDKLITIADQANNVAEAIQEISDSLNAIPDNIDIGGSIEQFEALGKSVDKATASISGGVISKADTSDGTSGKNATNAQGSSCSNGSGSLVSAIKEVKSEADKSIGTGEDSGAIGQFNQLGQSVADVTSEIGGGSGNRVNSGNDDSGNLISSIENLGETTTETLGEPDGDGVTGKFGELGDTIADAENHVTGIIDGLNDLDGMTAECTIMVSIETRGGIPQFASGTAIDGAIGSMNLSSSNHNPRYSGNAHMEGTAKVTGDWGARDAGKALVGELGQEIVVSSNGRWRTVGDNGAEFIELQKGDIVFNHLQTRELLSRGNLVGRGKALAGGTALVQGTDGEGWFTTPDGQVLRPIQPGDRAWELQKAFEPLLKTMDGNLDYLAHNAMIDHQKQMEKMVNQLNAGSVVNDIANNKPSVNIGDINVTCPGVTSQQVAEQLGGVLGKELDRQFSGFHNWTDQRSRIR